MRLRLLTAVIVMSSALLGCGGDGSTEVSPKPTTTIEPATVAALERVVADLKRVEEELVRSNVEQEELKKRLVRAEAAARASRSAAATRAPAGAATPAPTRVAAASSSACGGDLPPCYVLRRESGGDAHIWNGGCYAPVGWAGSRSPCGGSTASGLWQFIRSTWARFGGYLNAADAPVEVQNEKARLVWAGGRGCSHWSAC